MLCQNIKPLKINRLVNKDQLAPEAEATEPDLGPGCPWSLHPRPLKEELLSSWLARVARENGVRVETLVVEANGPNKVKGGWLDLNPSPGLLGTLAIKTRMDASTVAETTMGELRRRLLPSGEWRNGRQPWVLPAMDHWRDHGSTQFCPECLAEDPVPHLRREWRLAFVTICPRHRNRLLSNVCPQCHNPLDPVRSQGLWTLSEDKDPITTCFHCRFDLRTPEKPGREPKGFPEVRERAVVLQSRLLEALDQGWALFPGIGEIYSNLLFQGIRTLSKVLTTRRSAAKLRTVLLSRFPEGADCLPGTGEVWSQGIEFLSAEDRCRILATIHWLLEEWPTMFVGVCREAKLGDANIIGHRPETIPFWLADVARRDLSNQRAVWRDPERPKVEQISYEALARRKFSPRLAARERRLEFIRAWQGPLHDLKPLAKAMSEASLYSVNSCIHSIMKHLPKLIAASGSPTEWWRKAGRPIGKHLPTDEQAAP